MYNGIGLQTARGSGTNGYVQRNVALVRNFKDRIDYKSEEELKKLDAQINKGPNKEILDHERKRKVELKCMEMQELMEEQGYTKEEIERKVSTFRRMLIAKEGVSDRNIDTDDLGRPIAKETHQVAEATQAKNDAMKAALGISEYFKDGSSFDPERRNKEEQEKAVAMALKKYSIMRESSESKSPTPEKKSKKKKKKSSSKRSRSDSESSDRREHKKKKKKKRRHHHSSDDDSAEYSSDSDQDEAENNNQKNKGHSRSEEKKGSESASSADSSSESEEENSDSDSAGSESGSDESSGDEVDQSSEDDQEGDTESEPESEHDSDSSEADSDPEDDTHVTEQGKAAVELAREKTCQPKSEISDNRKASEQTLKKEGGSNKKSSSSACSNRGSSKRGSVSQGHSKHRKRTSRSSRSRSSREKRRKPRRKSRSERKRRHTNSGSHSHSCRSPSSRSCSRSRIRSTSRSPSIRRRKGSPSHLERRRITSARKRPVPYHRPSAFSSDSDWSCDSSPATRYYPHSPPRHYRSRSSSQGKKNTLNRSRNRDSTSKLR